MVKIVCRYRAELFFKISRKTKLSKLFNAWTDRMDAASAKREYAAKATANGTANVYAPMAPMQFVFTHSGRALDAELTPEEAGMDDEDEILAIELMDLTEEPEPLVRSPYLHQAHSLYSVQEKEEVRREMLQKFWENDPAEYVPSFLDL
jgi:hypothetical protein